MDCDHDDDDGRAKIPDGNVVIRVPGRFRPGYWYRTFHELAPSHSAFWRKSCAPMISRELVARSMSYVTKRERPPRLRTWVGRRRRQAPISSSSFTDAITAIGRAWTRGHRSHPETPLPVLAAGQKPDAILLCQRSVFRPFSCDVLTWPQSILSGQAGFIILCGGGRSEPRQCLAVIPGHPLRWITLQLLGVPLQLGQIMHGALPA